MVAAMLEEHQLRARRMGARVKAAPQTAERGAASLWAAQRKVARVPGAALRAAGRLVQAPAIQAARRSAIRR